MNNFNSCFRKLTLPVAVPRMGKRGNTVMFSTSKGWHWSDCPRDTSKIQWVRLLWKKEHNLENITLYKGQSSVRILAFLPLTAVIGARSKNSKQFSSPWTWVPRHELKTQEGVHPRVLATGFLNQKRLWVSASCLLRSTFALTFFLAVISVLPCLCWSC